VRLALVGCGDIARRYAEAINHAEPLELAGATDVVPERAEALIADVGGRLYASVDELLADDTVDTVVNLTVPHAHAQVTAAALEAGKHVHTEKPLALAYDEARELVELAAAKGLRVSAAPSTLFGEAQQTAWRMVRDGAFGRVRAAYAEANWGRIERWHPSPQGLLSVGPMVDVGIYPITILTAMFGPARRVVAYGTTLYPDRVTKAGDEFRLEADDFVVAVLELADDVVARVTASFYTDHPSKQQGIELHGDRGSLFMATWAGFDSRLELALEGQKYEPVPHLREAFKGMGWSHALVDLADAIARGRPHRASAEQAAHVVEVLEAIDRSARTGAAVEVRSHFERPEPLDWAA
jgi:predicted dehydrogenase